MLVALVALAVCGCGSHHEDDLYGRFEAGTVTGLRYTTLSGTGLTGVDGNFRYRPGETVTFSIGGITLGSAPGAGTISPLTLAGIEAPMTESAVRARFVTVFRKDSEMMRAVRITRLLLSLDIDGDPDNGIDLTGRDAGLAQASLDVGRDEGTFGNAIERLADDTNANISLGYPVRYLFEQLGITLRAHALVSESGDLDGDGMPEFTESRRQGPDGSVVSSFDSNADGIPESVTTTFPGPLGRELSHRIDFDNDGDGVIDSIQTSTTTYDVHGRALLHETEDDNDADGVVDQRSRVIYTLGYNGRTSAWLYESDTDLDGLANLRRTSRLTYDDRRNQTQYLSEFDDDGDGSVNFRERIRNTYDVADLITMQDGLADFDGDGVYDWHLLLENTYDGAGQWISGYQELDEGNDGTVDTHTLIAAAYDASGNQTAQTSTTERFSPPSLRGTSIYSTYDALHGPLTVIHEIDSDGDGTPDSRRSDTTTYDGDGRELSVVSFADTDGDGTANLDSTTTMTYGADGQLLKSVRATDNNADGTVDETYITTSSVVDEGIAALVYEYFGF